MGRGVGASWVVAKVSEPERSIVKVMHDRDETGGEARGRVNFSLVRL